MMGPFLGPMQLTTLTNNINNNELKKEFHSCRDTIDTQDILFLLYSLSSGSPFMLLLLPLCNITRHAICSAKSRHRPVMTDDIPMWSRSGTATPR